MTIELTLPGTGGALIRHRLNPAPQYEAPRQFTSRIAYAAAHVVCDPLAEADPIAAARIDWEATLAYRRYLWSLGFAVAEAMDTAQRGMGLGWDSAAELIRRSVAQARTLGATVACGAGTDQLAPRPGLTTADVAAAYEEQCAVVEDAGGRIILMASRALAACAEGAEDYVAVYDRILGQVRQPVILHWLGPMFDPALEGYWGSHDLDVAMEICLHIIRDHAAMIDGIKISLLDRDREVKMRRLLPPGVRMYSGDDFNYPELIAGDDYGYSHALLGVFDAIAPAAASALAALDDGDLDRFYSIMEPTVPLSRHIFQAPTMYYKTGVVFLAYLNGHQQHFRMIGGLESARSVMHLAELFVLADRAGLLRDPEMAAERMRRVLAVAGIE